MKLQLKFSELLLKTETSETVKHCQMLDQFFDFLNVRSLESIKGKPSHFWNCILIKMTKDFSRWRMSSFCVIRVCSSDKMTPIYFLRLSKVWSMLRHGSLWLVHKKMLINSFMYFFGILLLFLITKFVFLSFSFLFLIKYQTSGTEY